MSSRLYGVLDALANKEFSRYTGFDSVSVASGTSAYTKLGSVTVPAGKGMLVGAISYPANATGGRRLVSGANNATPSMGRNNAMAVSASNQGNTVMQVTMFYENAEDTSYELYAMQNSGSTFTVNASVSYVQF